MSRYPYDYGKTKPLPGDFILKFGKYKGKQLREVRDLRTLDHYLKWDQLRQDARDAIHAWLSIPTNAYELEQQLSRGSES